MTPPNFRIHPHPHPLPPIRKPLPPRIKVSYARGVTVCIAAIGSRKNGSGIVLCCDSRLDQGVFGSTDDVNKLRFVRTGWLAMLSGRWEAAQELSRTIGARFQQQPGSLSDALVATREGAKDFRVSAFFSKQGTEEALVTGFVGEQPIILHVAGQMSVDPVPFGAIGEGYNIATVMLHQRDCSQMMSLEQVAYIVYEAKRCSEKASSVGKRTTLIMQYPTPITDPENTVNMDMFNLEGLRFMDAMYRRLWLRDISPSIKPFPKRCFEHPEGQ